MPQGQFPPAAGKQELPLHPSLVYNPAIMDIEAFPEIENFQKLPRRVIVKGGGFTLAGSRTSELRGLVINNIGNPICGIVVNLVVFDANKIPQLSTSVPASPDRLDQGGIAS